MAKSRGGSCFGGYIACYLVLFFCCAAAVVYYVWPTEEHAREYAGLNKLVEKKDSAGLSSRSKIQQTRVGVCKDILHDSNGKRHEMKIACGRSELAFKSEKGETCLVEYMTDVHCCMDGFLGEPEGSFDAKHAEYHFGAGNQSITLSDQVEVQHRLGMINADKIVMAPSEEKESFKEPLIDLEGHVGIHHAGGLSAHGDFGSYCPSEDRQNDTFSLKGNVTLSYENSLSVANDDRVRIISKEVEAKKEITRTYAEGITKIAFVDEVEGVHELTCDGLVMIDHEKNAIHFLSANAGKQISFTDKHGQIFADRAVLDYEIVNKKFEAKRILLRGNVSLVNRIPGDSLVGEKAALQYAISDEAEYDPNTRTLKLVAAKDKRVLLYDKVNQLQVSAPQLNIHRDKKTKKDSVIGVGDVRFSFKDKEIEQFKQVFAR